MQDIDHDLGEITSLVEHGDAGAARTVRPLGRRRPAPPRRPRILAVMLLLPVVAAGLLLSVLCVRLDVVHRDDTGFDWDGVARLRDGFFQLFNVAGGYLERASDRHIRLRHPDDRMAQSKGVAWEAQENLNCWAGTGSTSHPCCGNAGKALGDLEGCQASCLHVPGCNCVTHQNGLCWFRHNCTFRSCVEAEGFTSARTAAGSRAALPMPVVDQPSDAVASAVRPESDGPGRCHTAKEGERCYEHVIWAMTVGFKQEPSWYKGLSTNSSLDDFQALLHDDPEKGCPRPCGSALAILERSAEAIAEHVLPALAQGPPRSHGGTDAAGSPRTTEPYEGLQASSSTTELAERSSLNQTTAGGSLRTTEPYEDSQASLSTTELAERSWPNLTTGEPVEGSDPYLSTTQSSLAVAQLGDGGTTSWTTTAERRDVVTLFCWSIFLAGEREMGLLTYQRAQNASIFACADYLVFLNDHDRTFTLPDPRFVRLDTSLVPRGEPWKGHTTDSWLNTETFMLAWDGLLKDGRYRGQTWVVKVDPDCVFFPQRLVTVLLGHADRQLEKSLLLNCYRIYGENDGRPAKLFGSLEVLSTVAMEAFLDVLETCKTELPWSGWGEDFFMQSCLETVGAEGLEEFEMMRDENCWKVEDPCNDGGKVAFHPFKDREDYEGCMEESAKAARAYIEAQLGIGAEVGE